MTLKGLAQLCVLFLSAILGLTGSGLNAYGQGVKAPVLSEGGLTRPLARLGTPQFDVSFGTGVALSPEGKEIAVNGMDADPIFIWDADRARLSRQTEPFTQKSPYAPAWSARGDRITAINVYGGMRVWHATGRTLWQHKSGNPNGPYDWVKGFRFINGDRHLAAIIHRPVPNTWRLDIWDAASGQKCAGFAFDKENRGPFKDLPANFDIRDIAFSPSGERAAWLAVPAQDVKGGGSMVWLCETATGKVLHILKDLPRCFRIGQPDEGKTLIVFPVRPKVVDGETKGESLVINISDGKVKFRCEHRYRPDTWSGEGATPLPLCERVQQPAVRFSNSLLIADEVGLCRWDLETGKKLGAYDEPLATFSVSADEKRIAVHSWSRVRLGVGELPSVKSAVFAQAPWVRFLPDGRLVGADSSLFDDGMSFVWDPKTKALLDSRRVYAWPGDFDHDRSMDESRTRFLYRSTKGDFVLHDLRLHRPLAKFPRPVPSQAMISGDGKRVLVTTPDTDNFVLRWFDADTTKELGTFRMPMAQVHRRFAAAQWFSTNGAAFGFETADGGFTLVDCASGKTTVQVRPITHEKWTRPEWEYHGADQFRLIWAKPTGDALNEAIASVAEHFLWDRQGRVMRRFSLPVKRPDPSLQRATPDGRTVAVLTDTRDLEFFETATGRRRGYVRASIRGNRAFDELVDFSPDGSLLATSSHNSVLLWSLAQPLSGKPPLPAPASVKQADALWDKLGDPDPAESDRALWALVKAPEHALAMLKARLTPAPLPDAEAVHALIMKLDSTSFAERDAAQKQLRGMKEALLPILREARKGASVEQAHRLNEVIAEMQVRLESPDAIRVSLRELRALEVLERIGTPEARRLVESLARGADSVASFEAQLIEARWPR